MKSNDRAVGLTQNLGLSGDGMVAVPKVVRVTAEFEASMEGKKGLSSETRHHERTKHLQAIFARHVMTLLR